jgi:protein tyrosine phosphatase (PTP) superfamily phosphohydrolase (DUF442 family)
MTSTPSVFGRIIAARRAWRSRRAERWKQPISGGFDRFSAWISMLFADAGLFRLPSANLFQVSPGLFRSGQPNPVQLARWARRFGLKTVVSLRGHTPNASFQLETEACRRLGLGFIPMFLRSRALPSRAELLDLIEFIDKISEPTLVHCKSGADRVGLFSALYLMLRDGRSAAEARNQLSIRFGHFSFAKTGVLGALIDRYRRDGEAFDLPFRDWARTLYDPEAITRDFEARFVSSLIVDRILRRE